MQCVILPEGVGTRLWPLSKKSFRPLLPLANVPFVHYQLSWLSKKGITQVVYPTTGPGSQVRAFVGDGLPWGLHVDYVQTADGESGSALRRAEDAGLLSEWFFVLSGPSFLPVDFRRMSATFLGQERPALMAVFRNRGLLPAGDVRYSDGVVRLYQKARRGEIPPGGMDHRSSGLSVVRREVIGAGPWGQSGELAELYHRLSVSGRLAGVEVSQGEPATEEMV